MPNIAITGYAASFFATIIWAGNFIAARALAWQIPPFQFNFWRWVIAFVFLLPFAWPHLKNDLPLAKKHYAYISLMAIIGITLMNSFIYKAGETAESLNMALIMPATPAVITILAWLFYGEKISWRRFYGLVICISGILILITRGDFHKLIDLEFKSGDIWTLGCMLCFALYSLFLRKRDCEISSLGFNVIVFGAGIIFSLPIVIAEMYFLPLPVFSWKIATGVLYSGIGCSAIAFWLWTIGVDKLGPVKAGFVYYSLPVFAGIMAKIILDENVTLAQIMGGILIISGIFTATFQLKKGRN